MYFKVAALHTISAIVGYSGQVNKMSSNDLIRHRVAEKQSTNTL